jgi:hypothetical protein
MNFFDFINQPTKTERKILMKLSELLTINESLVGQLSHIESEVVDKLAELQTAIDNLTANLADVELTPEQAQSVLDVQVAVQELDDIIPEPIPGPLE